MRTWNVEVEWKMRAYIEVEAPSPGAARRLAREADIPDDGECVEESLRVTGMEPTT